VPCPTLFARAAWSTTCNRRRTLSHLRATRSSSHCCTGNRRRTALLALEWQSGRSGEAAALRHPRDRALASASAADLRATGEGGRGGCKPFRFGEAEALSTGGAAHRRQPDISYLSREPGLPSHTAPASTGHDFSLSDVLTKHGRERDDPSELRFEHAAMRRGSSANSSSSLAARDRAWDHARDHANTVASHGEGEARWTEVGGMSPMPGSRGAWGMARADSSERGGGGVAPRPQHPKTIESYSSLWSRRPPSAGSASSPHPLRMGTSASEAPTDVSSSYSSGEEASNRSPSGEP
jgi:hypothetical protein